MEGEGGLELMGKLLVTVSVSNRIPTLNKKHDCGCLKGKLCDISGRFKIQSWMRLQTSSLKRRQSKKKKKKALGPYFKMLVNRCIKYLLKHLICVRYLRHLHEVCYYTWSQVCEENY